MCVFNVLKHITVDHIVIVLDVILVLFDSHHLLIVQENALFPQVHTVMVCQMLRKGGKLLTNKKVHLS